MIKGREIQPCRRRGHIKKAAPLFVLALSLLGCQPNISPDSYPVSSAGQVNRSVRGMVVSARTVDIQGSQSGVGTMAGTATGAVAGSAIGSSTRANVIGAIGGAVIGGVVGGAVEEGTTRQQGMEYVVETEDGTLLTIVQGIESPLQEGDRVIVVYGARARVIADPSRN